MADVEAQTGNKKDRSPSFPFIPLTKALERTRALFDAGKRHEMRMSDAAAAMGYGPKSSGTIQTLAALLAYGLIEDSGSGEARKFKVSDLGFKALEDQRPGAKEAALAEAALKPKLIAEYADVWRAGRPADGICISELRIDRGFSEDGAKNFLRVFDDTIGYARLDDSDKVFDINGDKVGSFEPPEQQLAVGDLVRVESAGQVIFEKVPVRALQEHGGQTWVFVEGSEAGSKMSDVSLLEKAPDGGAAPPPTLPLSPVQEKPSAGEEMDRFTVDEGVVKIVFPTDMAADSVEELEQFLNLFIKKAKRRARSDKKSD